MRRDEKLPGSEFRQGVAQNVLEPCEPPGRLDPLLQASA